MEEIKLENIEFIENKDLPIDVKIKIRISELEEIKKQTIEKLKIEQQLIMTPINAVIEELKILLSEEKNNG